ncbi:MAG TPA: hypothetical protein VEA15_01365 [Caulobacteraceae bacterium]|nr:hypothetical protein [Caulobacteraceae bacterium]
MKRLALIMALTVGLGGAFAAFDVDAQSKGRGRSLRDADEVRGQSGEIVKDGKKVTPEEQKAQGMANAPAVLQRAGVACTVSDALYTGEGTKAGADGKPVKVQTYEVACNEGLGFLLEDRGETAAAYDCIVAKTAADNAAAAPAPAAKGGKPAPKAASPVCTLPGNADLNRSFQPILTQAGAKCTVTNISYLGSSPATKVGRYEVACQEGLGYLVDRPESAASTAPLKAVDCLAAEAGGYDCTLTPKAQRVAFVAAMASTAGRPCTVSDARAMGANASGSTFYEVGCGSAPGYVMEVKGGRVARAIDCLEAAGIGGGCKLTSTQVVMEAKEGQYLQTLRAKGVNCVGDEFRLIGKDTRNNRDVVEFKCSDRVGGLVAFIPQTGGGNVTSFDCIEAEGRGIKCNLTDRAAIMKQLSASLTRFTCNVTNYAVLGQSATDGEVLEVACAGRTGMIVDIPTSRGAATKGLTCQVSAERGGDKCTLPENKA